MGSTRLPRKVLLPLGGKTVLEQTIDHVKNAKNISDVIVATSDQSDDDAIYNLCKKIGVECFRGSLDDVLDRYYRTAKKYGAEHICRVTSDCPLIDSSIIDRVAEVYLSGKYDYVSSGRIETTFPDGMDTEIFSFEMLEKAWKEAKLPSEREHVTPYIWEHPEKFKVYHLQNEKDLSYIRLTIDKPADYELFKIIFEKVKNPTLENILSFFKENPEMLKINSGIIRNEGYIKSLEEDKQFNEEKK